MDYLRVGNSGLKISQISFGSALTIGTENKSQYYSDCMIDTAWSLGIRSFDTSNNYGDGKAEILVSESLKKYSRQDYIISTKGSWPIGDGPYKVGLSRKHILWAFEESINRMKLDYVDIYYAHRYYNDVPMEEIVRTYNSLISQGKIRYWATSEWPVDALKECIEVCENLKLEKPILEQSFFSFAVPKIMNNGVKDFCDNNGIGLLGFGILGQGLLTGKYKNGIPEDSRIYKGKKINYLKTLDIYNQNKKKIDRFLLICEKYNANSTAVALQWCIRKGVFPIIGASKPEQLKENIYYLKYEINPDLWLEIEM